MSKTEKSSTAATTLAPKLFSISFYNICCLSSNICSLSSNINQVHHHLQPIYPYALFLVKTKIKPLDPNDRTFLAPCLKCSGYELFTSFSANGGVCAFISSDVQTLHLKQSDLSNPSFKIIGLEISLSHTTKYIFTLLTQTTMNFFLTSFLNQSKPSLYNLQALKSLFLVISTSTNPTGSPIPPMSPTLLVGMLRPLPLPMT